MALIGEMHYLTIGGNTYAIPTSGGSTVSITRTLTSGTKTATISVDGTSYDLYAPTPNAGTITSVKTTAGAHTAINVSSGTVSFNVPTKTSHLTNDSGFLTVAVTSISTAAGTHTPQAQAVTGDVSFNIPTKTSHLVNDSGFLTSHQDISGKANKATTLAGYGITDAYTKTQVDGLVAGVLHYKGTKATVSALPTSGNTTGDVWHVTADGSEWAWDGSAWQELGTAIDLSGYAQLAGASFTGPVTFGDSVTADELETGDLVVTGAASFTNNIAANTINGVAVGNSPKFTDTVTTVTTTGDGNAITAISATNGAITATKGTTFLTSHQTVSNKGATLAWGTATTVATIGSTDIKVSLPANPNTHNTAYLYAGASNGTANAATTNGNTYLILMDGGTATTRRKISGATNVSVASDSSGNITITGPNLSGYALSSAIPTKTSQLTNDGNGTSAFATLADIGSFGGGTVTSITLKAGSGITLDTDNTAITTTGTRTISHADTSSQASSSNSGRTYIQSLTLDTYGHVTGISTATETVTNTDTKLQVAAVTSGTTYYPIVGTGTTAATRQYDTTGFIYKGTNGTTSAVGSAQLTLGNSTASGTANNKQGQLIIYGSTAYAHTISGAPTAARTLTLPNKTGTIALTSDIPDISGLSTKPSEIANSSSSTVRLRFYNNGSEFYDGTGASYSFRKGTASSSGSVSLILGNSIASGTDGSQRGSLDLYGDGTNYVSLYALSTLTSNRTVGFPDKSGTVALISDIPTVPSSTGSATTGITASTTATKTTLGTAFTIPNVTSAGSASTWAFEDIACDDITSWSAGSGSASISGAVDSSDSTQLNITISHTHTAPSLSYTARTVSSKKSGANGSAPTLGTAFTVPNVTGNTSATVSITDNGHTHTI